jgi:hypothetical protein
MKKPLPLAILGAIALFLLLFAFHGYEATWQLWNIPTMMPPFADLRSITGLSVTVSQGYDPTLYHPGDPWQRPFNYPPIWKMAVPLGVTPEHTLALGILLIGFFLIGLYLVFRDLSLTETIFVMLGLLSPAVLLGIERGNIDLFIFFLVALAVWLVGKSLPWAAFVLQVAYFLKLYPIFGLPTLLRGKQKTALLLIALVLGISTLYFLSNYRELISISNLTPRSHNLSYGTDVFPLRIQKSIYSAYIPTVRILTNLAAFAILMIGTGLGSKIDLSSDYRVALYLDAFRAGSAIYIGTFFLGNNFDYRLMFLLLTIPQLVGWWQSTSSRLRWIAKITGVALYFSLYHRLILRGIELLLPPDFPGSYARALAFLPDETANWTLFAGLIFLLSASLPHWLFDFRNWFQKHFPIRYNETERNP